MKSDSSLQKSRKTAYRYIMPAVIVLAVIVIVPTLFLWLISLTNYDLSQGGSFRWVGLINFIRLLSGEDSDFWPSVQISIALMVVTVLLEFVLGLGIAVLFNRKIFAERLWMSCLIVPLAITPASVGLMWKLMLNSEYGVLNYLLQFLNLKVNWLVNENALLSIAIVDIWQWTPFVALILYSGLQSLPVEPYESAVVDGANGWQIFVNLTLPLLRPMIIIALLLRSIDSLKIFDTIYVLTRGGPGNATETLSLHIYRLAFEHLGYIGRSSAVAVLLLFITTVLCTSFLKVMQKGNQGERV